MTAVQQIIQNSRKKTASKQDETALIKKIEEACRKFDKKNTGFVGDMDVVNILGLVNVHCQHEKVYSICSHLPRNRGGKMRIHDFVNLPILSEEAFNALDK